MSINHRVHIDPLKRLESSGECMLCKGRSIPEKSQKKVKLIICKCLGKGRDVFHTRRKKKRKYVHKIEKIQEEGGVSRGILVCTKQKSGGGDACHQEKKKKKIFAQKWKD